MFKQEWTVKDPNITVLLKKARQNLYEATKEIVQIGEETAKAVLAQKRKSPPSPSPNLVDSFATYSQLGEEIYGYVVCGGLVAPHAIFVEEDRVTQNFKGYKFMEAGALKMVEVTPSIVQKHIKKIGG